MDIYQIQEHTLNFLKQQKVLERTKIRNLQFLSIQKKSIDSVYDANEMEALLQIHSVGMSMAKLLKCFYKINEIESEEILALNAALERYFVDIETKDTEFTMTRLVLNAKFDQLIRKQRGGRKTKRDEKNKILSAIKQFDVEALEKGLVLLIAVHSMIKKRLVDIEKNNKKLIGRHFALCAKLKDLKYLTRISHQYE